MWISLLVGILPSIFQFVEQIHPKATVPGGATAPSTGKAKMAAAIQLAQAAVTMGVQTGAIPASKAPTVTAIQNLAQQQFDFMKSKGVI